MKIKASTVLYSILCNIPVCFCLCLTSAISNQTTIDAGIVTIALDLNWGNIGINFAVCFTCAMIISLFVPLYKIGVWFTSLFGVKADTYAGNVPYRILATISSSIVFYAGITPVATILNCYIINHMAPSTVWFNVVINLPIMLLVGFVSSLLSDIAAYRAAHKIDPTF